MRLPVIGITMGDPTGIGPEIIVKALCREDLFPVCRPVVFGDPLVLRRAMESLGRAGTVEPIEILPEEGYTPGKIFVRSGSSLDPQGLQVGKPSRACGEAMAQYVEEAVRWVLGKKIDAITTCPINKHAINEAGVLFPGHTEYLAHLAAVSSVAMMFVGSRWNVVLVTIHHPLKEVARLVTRERVLKTIEMTYEGLKNHFRIREPRIAVLGLNPHCGEEGLLGEEETKEILPALFAARGQGIAVEGPFPSDSFFDVSGHLGAFDAVVAMYHDQGLIPIKMLDFEGAVNLTLGLPFIRTSVAHGTAYDIAGKGIAREDNLIRAIQVAAGLLKRGED